MYILLQLLLGGWGYKLSLNSLQHEFERTVTICSTFLNIGLHDSRFVCKHMCVQILVYCFNVNVQTVVNKANVKYLIISLAKEIVFLKAFVFLFVCVSVCPSFSKITQNFMT